jgi:hypothetical protein
LEVKLLFPELIDSVHTENVSPFRFDPSGSPSNLVMAKVVTPNRLGVRVGNWLTVEQGNLRGVVLNRYDVSVPGTAI